MVVGSSSGSSSSDDEDDYEDDYGGDADEEDDCAICREYTEEDAAMIRCASCRTQGHPSCLEMPAELAAACRTYKCEFC